MSKMFPKLRESPARSVQIGLTQQTENPVRGVADPRMAEMERKKPSPQLESAQDQQQRLIEREMRQKEEEDRQAQELEARYKAALEMQVLIYGHKIE